MRKTALIAVSLFCALMLAGCQHEHTEEIIPAVAATCTTDGATEGVKCAKCDEILTAPQIIPAAHAEEVIPAVAVTCTTDGATEGTKCAVCGVTLSEPQPLPAAHEWDDGTVLIAPTCTKIGAMEHNCLHCGKILVMSIPETGHTESDWITDKEAACTKDGSRHVACTVCGEVLKTEAIPATGHKDNGITCDTCGQYTIEMYKTGKSYKDASGLTVTVHSFTATEYKGYIAYTVRYTIKNKTPDTKVLPGLFKILFDDDTAEPQYGFFDYLYYGDSDSRAYTWKVMKNQKVLALEYNIESSDDYFSNTASSDGFHWAAPKRK